MTNEEIVKRIQDGNRELFPQLWEQVKKFAYLQAKRFITLHQDHDITVDAEDLGQEAYFAMIEAANKFEESKSNAFLTYYDYYLLSYFMYAAGLRTKRQRKVLNAESLYTSISDKDEDLQLIDMIEDEKQYIEEAEDRIYTEQLHGEIESLINEALQTKEKEVIKEYFFYDKSIRLIAEEKNISIASVNKIKKQSLRKLKYKAKTKKYRSISEYAYQHVGISEFQRTHESIVEKTVFRLL